MGGEKTYRIPKEKLQVYHVIFFKLVPELAIILEDALKGCSLGITAGRPKREAFKYLVPWKEVGRVFGDDSAHIRNTALADGR
ncbi:hypothetical protein D3C71_2119990 [compost metagenome]